MQDPGIIKNCKDWCFGDRLTADPLCSRHPMGAPLSREADQVCRALRRLQFPSRSGASDDDSEVIVQFRLQCWSLSAALPAERNEAQTACSSEPSSRSAASNMDEEVKAKFNGLTRPTIEFPLANAKIRGKTGDLELRESGVNRVKVLRKCRFKVRAHEPSCG